MATYSLNQLIKIFNDFADSHLQINSFGFGEVFEANGNPKTTGNTPTLWIFPTQATPLENTTIYSFDVRCWDLVTKGEENENDVLSDCQQTLFDFIQFIKHNEIFDINVSGDPSLTPFTEQLADDVTGWECSIDIEVNSINSDCMIPMGSITPYPNPLNCDPVTVTDGVTITEVASGGVYTCSGGGGSDATVNVNSTLYSTVASGGTLNIPVKNSANTNVGTINAGVDVTITDDTVTNSDASVTVSTVVQGVTKVLSDVTMTQPNGSTVAHPSMKNFACTLIGALATQDLNDDLTPTQINQIQRQQPTRTAQVTLYRTGDDGDLQMGIGASFSTLSDNNIFGNTSRFTDQTGAQIYATDFVLDHLTGLMWQKTPNTLDTWNNSIDNALAYSGGLLPFTDWFLPNVNQFITILSFQAGAISLNYAPFSIATAEFYWTSTTQPNSTLSAIRINNSTSLPVAAAKTGTNKTIYCRKWIPSDFGL